MPQKLQLFASGLSRSNLLTLSIYLDSVRGDEAANWELTDSFEAAAALLVDADSAEGHKQLMEWAANNDHQVVMAFSSRATGFPENVLVVPRPLRAGELIPILQQASRQYLRGEKPYSAHPARPTVGPSANVRANDKLPATSDPGKINRVLEYLYNGRDKLLKATDKAGRSVIFEMTRRRYYTTIPIPVEFVEDLIASPIESVRLEELNSSQFEKETQLSKPQDLEPPLWTAALAVSNGQLFAGLSPDGSYRLNRWPDLKKLGRDPLHLKLTALLRRGGTIDYFAEFTKEPKAGIIDFLNACHALNCLENQAKPTVSAKASEQRKLDTGKRSLLGMIRSRLGI